MLFEPLITVFFGALVGLALGLTGGGGSIFAIPLLVYGLGMGMTGAVPVSLIAVALTAAIGAWYSYRAGLLLWQPVLFFSLGGVTGAPGGIALSRYIEQTLLLTGFSVLVLVVGLVLWRKTDSRPEESRVIRAITGPDDKPPVCKLSMDGKLSFTTPCAMVLLLAGLLTGVLSGLFGVGGGFLIVPALMSVIELGIHRAVAASLMIITLIGISGAGAAFINGDLPWAILLPFVGGSILGMFLGRSVAGRIAGPTLQRAFAGAILGTGMLMLTVTLMS